MSVSVGMPTIMTVLEEELSSEVEDGLAPLHTDILKELNMALGNMQPSGDENISNRTRNLNGLYAQEWQRCVEHYQRLQLDSLVYLKRSATSYGFPALRQSDSRFTLSADSRRQSVKTAPTSQSRRESSRSSFLSTRANSFASPSSPQHPRFRRQSSMLSTASKTSRSDSAVSSSTRSQRPSITHLRHVLLDSALPKLADLDNDEEDESVFSDNAVAAADVDPDTRRPRKRKHLLPKELCEELFQRGFGDPRDKVKWQEQTLPPVYFKQAALKKQSFYMEKLKGKSRVECDLANAKASAFCEQQMQKHIRTVSANWRMKYQRFLEERKEDDSDAGSENQFDGEDEIVIDEDLDFSMNQGIENRSRFVDYDLIARIKNWISDVEKATADKKGQKDAGPKPGL